MRKPLRKLETVRKFFESANMSLPQDSIRLSCTLNTTLWLGRSAYFPLACLPFSPAPTSVYFYILQTASGPLLKSPSLCLLNSSLFSSTSHRHQEETSSVSGAPSENSFVELVLTFHHVDPQQRELWSSSMAASTVTH